MGSSRLLGDPEFSGWLSVATGYAREVSEIAGVSGSLQLCPGTVPGGSIALGWWPGLKVQLHRAMWQDLAETLPAPQQLQQGGARLKESSFN